jgi:predicted RNA-binding protein with PUA-like domain
MANWLFKEEPTHYSFADLEKDGSTTWEGVSNPVALKNLRQVKKGDRVFYYHTGKEKAIVGEMIVVSAASAEVKDTSKAPTVTVSPVRRLAQPVTLKAIKADKAFADWDLVRNSRLSVMPVTDSQWQRVEQMSKD